jgi:hypothetical protein
MTSTLAQINECRYLCLSQLAEPEENCLHLVIEEASVGAPIAGEGPVAQAAPIEHRKGDRVFELFWPSYVGYSVRNESFTVRDQAEQFEGTVFRLYSKSRYLDFIAQATIASDDYPGPFKHWGIICLNHIIDIVAAHDPIVQINGAA